MKGLNKKIARDIRKNKIQFFNIFIMIFLGVFVFAGIHAYMDGMKYSADDYYKNNNLEDIWVSGLSFSDEDFDNVKKIDNVHNVERQTIINTTVKTVFKTATNDTSCGFIILVTLTVYHTHGQITTTYFAFILKFC